MTKLKNLLLSSAVIALGLLGTTGAAFAHHSFAAEFDSKKPGTMTGSFVKLEWTNPHAHFYLNVKDAEGKETVWEFELASPNVLMRHGWTRNALKAGDMITVTGYLARDGAKLANARSVSLADGRKIFAGTADDGGPAQ